MSGSITAEIIAVGSELLTPSRLESNSLFITGRLNSLGVEVVRKVVVGDEAAKLSQAFRIALESADIVIFSGGLGPTNDDITREVVAETLGLELRLDSSLLERLQSLYRQYGFKMTANNRRQAMVPAGAEVMPNHKGTAPGLFLREGEKLVFLLPGPPRELEPMMDKRVLARIQEHLPTRRQYVKQLRVASLPESGLDARIEPLYKAFSRIQTTVLSSLGIIDIFFHWRGEDDARVAERQLEKLVSRVRQELGPAIFAEGPEELEAVLGRCLAQANLTFATAESCTGGLLGKLITDVDGSSAYYLGGVVSYSNQLKEDYLGVDQRTLESQGAVSEPAARQMAVGICRRTGADVGLSITGIAGPTGGTDEKPVGTVFIGLHLRGVTSVKKRRFPGGRNSVRLRSARFALDWLRRSLQEEP